MRESGEPAGLLPVGPVRGRGRGVRTGFQISSVHGRNELAKDGERVVCRSEEKWDIVTVS